MQMAITRPGSQYGFGEEHRVRQNAGHPCVCPEVGAPPVSRGNCAGQTRGVGVLTLV